MFFCVPYAYTPAGLFGVGHLLLLFATLLLLSLGLFLSRRMAQATVRRVLRAGVLLLWVLEIGKILFVLLRVGSRNPNDFVPLYYCSLILYAGLFSSFGKGKWQLAGDAFVATASLVGGAVFLIFPTSTLLQYPAWHLLSLHSFLLHGLMVYLGVLLLMRGVYRPVWQDIVYPACFVTLTSVLALACSAVWDAKSGTRVANLMFLSKNTPGTPLELLWQITGELYTPVMWLGQALLPFWLVYIPYVLIQKRRSRK